MSIIGRRNPCLSDREQAPSWVKRAAWNCRVVFVLLKAIQWQLDLESGPLKTSLSGKKTSTSIRASASGDLLLYVTTITKGLASMYRKGDVLVSLLFR